MTSPRASSSNGLRARDPGAAGIFLMAAVFVADIMTPLGYLDGILYAIPLLAGLWTPGGRYALSAASGATLFIGLDFFLSPAGVVPVGVVLVDRLGAAALLWGLAGAIAWRRRRDAVLERLSAIVESSDEAIIGLSRDGLVTSVNVGAERLYGIAAETLAGRDVRTLVAPEAAAEWDGYLSRIRAGETLAHVEMRFVRPDGRELWLSQRVSPVRNADGEVVGVSMIGRDISARRAAEERLALVLRSAPVLLLRLDGEGRITFIEGQPLAALGRSPADLVGKPIVALFGQEEWVLEETRRVLAGESFTAGGKAAGRWWETHYVPLRSLRGEPAGAVAVSIDVTERKEAEEKLVRQEALAHVGSMAAVVAHEVKNPLAGIGGAIQVLRDRLPAAAADREILTEILGRLKGLNALVQDLLDFARPRAPRFAPIALGATLQETVTLLTRDPSLAGVAVSVEGPDAVILGDADFLRDVFHNLLLNGAQATGGRGPIAVRIQPGAGRCRVEIRDRGPGIPAELSEKVFEPFFTTKHRGTGLGLSIARRLVEAHGGTLSLSPSPGGGTTAVVDLPLPSR